MIYNYFLTIRFCHSSEYNREGQGLARDSGFPYSLLEGVHPGGRLALEPRAVTGELYLSVPAPGRPVG